MCKRTSISAYLKKNIIAVSSGFDAISVPITRTLDASKHKMIKRMLRNNVYALCSETTDYSITIKPIKQAQKKTKKQKRQVMLHFNQPLGKSVISKNPLAIRSWQSVGRWYCSAVA